MRTIGAVLASITLAGCGTAPEPLPWSEIEGRDSRFLARSGSPAQAILGKEELTLADALDLAQALNPQLASERTNIDLATAAIWEARLYPNPSMLLEIEEYRTRDGASLGRSKRTAGIALPLVVSGRIGKAGSVAQAERDVAALKFVWRRREILSDVKRAYLTLLAARETIELARGSRDLARTLRDVAEERFRAQAVPEMEILKASIAFAKSEIDVRSAERDAAVALKALHVSVGQVDLTKDRFSGELASKFATPGLETLKGQVTSVHPLLEAARKSKEAAELDLELARAERIPDPQLEVTAGRDREDFTIIEGGISIPLPLFNRNQARIAKAESRIRQAELDVDAVRNDLVLKLTEAYRTFIAAQDRVEIYRDEILPKAGKARAQTEEGYRLGKFTSLDVLDAQRTLADARLAYAAALSELNLSAVDLEKITGTKLEPIR